MELDSFENPEGIPSALSLSRAVHSRAEETAFLTHEQEDNLANDKGQVAVATADAEACWKKGASKSDLVVAVPENDEIDKKVTVDVTTDYLAKNKASNSTEPPTSHLMLTDIRAKFRHTKLSTVSEEDEKLTSISAPVAAKSDSSCSLKETTGRRKSDHNVTEHSRSREMGKRLGPT